MATKPSSTFTFATDATFSSGPASGEDTKAPPTGAAQGFVPGDGIESPGMNYLLNICGQWVTNWLALGSSAAGEDAHLVETDANGAVTIARGTFGGHSVAGPSLTVTSSASGASLVVTGGGSNFGMTVNNGGGSLAALRATGTGTGYALEGLALGTDNTAIRGSGTGSGHGVLGEGGATGDGVQGESGATSGAGVRGTAMAAAGTGVIGIGFAAAASLAIDGQAGHADATAVRGLTDASATATGVGVQGTGQGSGVGVRASAADGYALVVVGDLTAPVSAAVRIAPQNAEPSGTDAEGDLYADSTDNQLHYRDDVGFRTLHQSPYGFVGNAEQSVTGGSTGGGPVSLSSVQISPYPNQSSREVVIIANVEIEDFTDDNGQCTIDIYDNTAAAVVTGSVRTIRAHLEDGGSTNANGQTATTMAVYTLPDASTRTFTLRITANTGSVTYDDNAIFAMGAFA